MNADGMATDRKVQKTVVGGIDEVQMWKKLEELDQLYDAAIRAERARYNALLDTYKKLLTLYSANISSNWQNSFPRRINRSCARGKGAG